MNDPWRYVRKPMVAPPQRPVAVAVAPRPTPVTAQDRTANPLRPTKLDHMIGQVRTRRYLRRVVDTARRRGEPLDHMLLVGPAGTGKSTVAHAVAGELGVDVYQVEAPVSHDTLLELREVMNDGDVLLIDEIHQQAVGDRRGRSSNTQPEVLFGVMEDRTIVSGYGVLPYPAITVIGATTDEGLLPDAFIDRFPVKPIIDPYEVRELAQIARINGQVLGQAVDTDAALAFATASRGVPRQVNNYVRNAAALTDGHIDGNLAEEVLRDFNRVTEEGLTLDMQRALTFLLTHDRQKTKAGDITYRASVDTIATAIGKSRDSKVVKLRIEPYLIERGYVQVRHGGRFLTAKGVKRAKELLT